LHDITARKRAEEALRESERKLKTLFEILPVGVSILDAERKIAYVNPALERILDISREGLFKGDHKSRRYLRPDGTLMAAEEFASVRAIKEQRAVHYVETGVVKEDGNVVWTDVSAVPVAFPDWKVVVVTSDITDRRRAEETLRESEEKFAKAFRASPNLMSITTLDGRIIDVNDAYCALASYSREELVGKSVLDFNVWADPEQRKAMVEQVRREGRARDLYVSLRTKSGEIRLLHFAAESIAIGGEQCLICVAKDVTEYRLAEEALRESERKYRELFENAREAIMTVDLEGRITDINKLVEEYGFKREELIGKRLFDFVPEYDRARAISDFDVLVGGNMVHGEMDVVTPKGIFTVEYRDNPIVRAGEVVGVQAILTDITERKKTEKELLDYQAKLKALAAELTLTEEHQRQRIAADIHDHVSQPLAISKMKLETLRGSAGKRIGEELKSVCGLLAQTIDEMRTLTFDLSSPILHELGLEQALREYLTECIENKHGIHTEFEDDGRPKPLDNDVRSLLFRDVRELLVNVVKHAEAKQVRVSVRRDGSMIRITVEDDGVGFDPVAAVSLTGKTGCFGLFSIRERLEDVGGHLEIDSSPGHGCKVTITAPLKRKEVTGGREKTTHKKKRN
jgi:PAS domain S-box-containing protein